MLKLNLHKFDYRISLIFSDEYPTTMMPVLTTPREARAFDFVPVNIIRDDGKETSFHERNFGDFSDVSLVPAGTNSRIQVTIPLHLNAFLRPIISQADHFSR